MEPTVLVTVAFMGGRAASFLDAVLEPVGSAIGGDLLAHYRAWAGKNAAEVLTSAERMLADAGQTPRPVPGRILMPILDYASREDDDDLRNKWASLLANAASATDANKVLPAFAEILRQLTPVQARLLQWMYEMRTEPVANWIFTWPDVQRSHVESTFEMSHADYALFITDLERLNVIEPRRDIAKDAAGTQVPMNELLQLVVDRWNSRVKYEQIGFTTLGIRFMEACTPPRSGGPVASQ